MPSKSRDGLKRDGSRDGKQRWIARIVGFDPATKRKIVDTERVIYADDKADALEQRKAAIQRAVEEKLGQTMGGGPLRFRAAVDLWVPTITRHSTQSVWKSYGNRAAKDFGERWLHKITTDEWQRWLQRQQGAKSTVAGIRMMLVNLYEWAIDNGHASRPNPVESTKLRRKRHTTDQAAKLAELETPKKKALLLEELGPYLDKHRELFPLTYPLVYTMLVLGTRYSEVSVLKRADVDWRTGEVTIRRAHVRGRKGPPKADKARAAAIAESCLELLRGHVAECGESEWLFPRPSTWYGKAGLLPVWSYATVNRHIRAAMAAAGVRTDNACHFARHTIKSLMEGAVPDAVLRKVIGHSSEKVHAMYGDAKVLEFARTVERELGHTQSGVSCGTLPTGRRKK